MLDDPTEPHPGWGQFNFNVFGIAYSQCSDRRPRPDSLRVNENRRWLPEASKATNVLQAGLVDTQPIRIYKRNDGGSGTTRAAGFEPGLPNRQQRPGAFMHTQEITTQLSKNLRKRWLS